MEERDFQLAAGNWQLAEKRYSVNRIISACGELTAAYCQLLAGSWLLPWVALKLTAFLFLGRIVHIEIRISRKHTPMWDVGFVM
jgi:hypothetical protein